MVAQSPAALSPEAATDTAVAQFWGIRHDEMPVLTGDAHARDAALRIIFDAYARTYGKQPRGGEWERKYAHEGSACFGAGSPNARERGLLIREGAKFAEDSLRRGLRTGSGFQHSKFSRPSFGEVQIGMGQFAKLVRETGIGSLPRADVDLIFLKARDTTTAHTRAYTRADPHRAPTAQAARAAPARDDLGALIPGSPASPASPGTRRPVGYHEFRHELLPRIAAACDSDTTGDHALE